MSPAAARCPSSTRDGNGGTLNVLDARRRSSARSSRRSPWAAPTGSSWRLIPGGVLPAPATGAH
eukprot:9470559-Alexandrium_andersonii.AAC.1